MCIIETIITVPRRNFLKEFTEGFLMDKFQCTICGHVYDPATGEPLQNIPPGIAFEKIPSDWQCPICGASKDKFQKM
jgi:rubredoxin